MPRLLAAEWLKLWSVRSTMYIITVAATTVAVSGLLTWSASQTWDHLTTLQRARAQMPPQPIGQTILPLAQLCLAALGVLAITSEHATGLIRTSLVAAPHRWQLMAAKIGVVAAIGLASGEIVVFATFLVTRWIVADRPFPGFAGPISDHVPLLVSMGVSVMVVALMGLGLGAALRSTAGAIGAVVVLVVTVPAFGAFLSASAGNERLAALMLSSLPAELVGQIPDSPVSPFGAGLAMAAYAAGALIVGAAVLIRADA